LVGLGVELAGLDGAGAEHEGDQEAAFDGVCGCVEKAPEDLQGVEVCFEDFMVVPGGERVHG
jgi:hypothetical protein